MNTVQVITSIVLFLLLDIIWIQFVMKEKYDKMIPNIQVKKIQTDITATMFAYVFLLLGLVFIVLPNIDKDNKIQSSLIYGMIFGLVVYGVYGMTAKALLSSWTWEVTILDLVWGGILYFTVAMIYSYLI